MRACCRSLGSECEALYRRKACGGLREYSRSVGRGPPLFPKCSGMVNSAHIYISRAQQRTAAVSHFPLQGCIVAVMAQVITGKGVAQHIGCPGFPPNAPSGSKSQVTPPLPPIARANAFISPAFRTFFQQSCQRSLNAYTPRAPCFTVLGKDADTAVRHIHLSPSQALHFMRADSGIEHHGDSWQANAFIFLFCTVEQLLYFIHLQNADRFLTHDRHFHLGNRIGIAPPMTDGCGKHAAHDGARFFVLRNTVTEGTCQILTAIRRCHATHLALRKGGIEAHQPPAKVPEIHDAAFPQSLGFPCGYGFLHCPSE